MSIRYWAAIATALATAALVDYSSELLANAGWLGGIAASDRHQEGVLPVAILAAMIVVGLGITIALRAGRGDRLRYDDWSARHRLAAAAAGIAATFAAIVLMEAYEMRFGGLSALDPRSIFAEHWPAVAIGYVLVSTLVGRIVAFALGAAIAAGRLVAHAIVSFLRIDRSDAAVAPCGAGEIGPGILQRPLPDVLGALGMRAPPARQLLHRLQLLT